MLKEEGAVNPAHAREKHSRSSCVSARMECDARFLETASRILTNALASAVKTPLVTSSPVKRPKGSAVGCALSHPGDHRRLHERAGAHPVRGKGHAHPALIY